MFPVFCRYPLTKLSIWISLSSNDTSRAFSSKKKVTNTENDFDLYYVSVTQFL